MVPFVSKRVVPLTLSDAICVLDVPNPLIRALSPSLQRALDATGDKTLYRLFDVLTILLLPVIEHPWYHCAEYTHENVDRTSQLHVKAC